MVCSVAKGSFRRYLALNLYMSAACLFSIARFKILTQYGLNSPEYFYFYYYSDALLTIGLFFTLISLYSFVLDEMHAERYVRLGAILLLTGTAWISYQIVQQSSHKLFTHFAGELSQNLYFVGLVLTYLLWGAIRKLRETRTRLIQLVLSLGLYFSIFAAIYAMRNLYPALHNVWPYLTPISGCLLPMAWIYAFWRLPEEARLAPARIALVSR